METIENNQYIKSTFRPIINNVKPKDTSADLARYLKSQYGDKMSQADTALAIGIHRSALSIIDQDVLPKHNSDQKETGMRVHYKPEDVAGYIVMMIDSKRRKNG